MHRLATSALEAAVWVGDGVAVTSLRAAGVELLGRPGPLDIFGRDDVALGIALLYPWANRLARDAYAIGGRRAVVGDGALRDRAGLPIHGFTGRDPGWQVVTADARRLVAQRRWRPGEPHWPALPVAHDVGVELELRDDALVVTTSVVTAEDVAVPVSFGWHPYLAPPGGHRAGWTLALPAAQRLAADERGIPTGGRRWQAAQRNRLADRAYDDAFAVAPRARARLSSREWQLTLTLDAGYPYLQVFAPPDRDVACIEPMVAPANALVSHDALPYAPPGVPFRARFTLRAERRETP